MFSRIQRVNGPVGPSSEPSSDESSYNRLSKTCSSGDRVDSFWRPFARARLSTLIHHSRRAAHKRQFTVKVWRWRARRESGHLKT
jgi:hypothetical protein